MILRSLLLRTIPWLRHIISGHCSFDPTAFNLQGLHLNLDGLHSNRGDHTVLRSFKIDGRMHFLVKIE